jgi:hypothetical protein
MINPEPAGPKGPRFASGCYWRASPSIENAPEFWPSSRDRKVSLITHLKRLIVALIFEYLF